MRDLYGTSAYGAERTAKRDVTEWSAEQNRHDRILGHFGKGDSYTRMSLNPLRVSFKLKQGAGRPSQALISSSLAHPQQALEKLLSSQVYGFKVLPGPLATPEEPAAALAFTRALPSRFTDYAKSVPAPLGVDIANDATSLASDAGRLFQLRDCIIIDGIPIGTPTSDKISNVSMPWGSRSDHLAMMHALLKGKTSNFNARAFVEALLA
jgi:hypothetical protein